MRVINPLRPSIGPYKRRRQIRDYNEDVQKARTRDLYIPQEIGHRKADQYSDQRGGDRHLKAVDQSTPIVLLGEELYKVT